MGETGRLATLKREDAMASKGAVKSLTAVACATAMENHAGGAQVAPGGIAGAAETRLVFFMPADSTTVVEYATVMELFSQMDLYAHEGAMEFSGAKRSMIVAGFVGEMAIRVLQIVLHLG